MRLWVVLDNLNTDPHPIDATDCVDLVQFKETIKKAYTPALDTISIPALMLRTFDRKIILPNDFLNFAMNQNSYDSPFIIEIVEFSISHKDTASRVTKRIKTMWIKSTGSYPALSLNKLSQFFEIPAKYLEFAKLLNCESDLVLYCRQNFLEQFEFIDKEVINKSRIGWILGPPGTGKSSAAFAFITTLDKEEWVVTWLNCSNRELHLCCVRLTDNCLWTCEVDRSSVSLPDILYNFNRTKKHLVILDGYTGMEKSSSEIMLTCQDWRTHDKEKKFLLIVSSMAGRYKHNTAQDDILGVNEFFVYSWNLQEYLVAVKYDNFLKNFKNYSNSITDADCTLSLEKLVESKFYYAGGNCRNMFMLSINEVIRQINESINQCTQISSYITRDIGDRSSQVINRLFSSYLVEGSRIYSLVSDYAVSELGKRPGSDTIKAFADCFSENPSLNGWLLEEWFFSRLCQTDIYLYFQDEQLEKVIWCKCDKIHLFDFKNFPNEDLDVCVNGAWLRPSKSNQKGFDAVYVKKNDGYVRFIQITRSKTHSLDLYSFFKVLKNFSSCFEIKTLEICFVIPRENLYKFKILNCNVHGMGVLEPFGWKHGKEREKIKILGIADWKRRSL